jgi:hypothetical protein
MIGGFNPSNLLTILFAPHTNKLVPNETTAAGLRDNPRSNLPGWIMPHVL